ncbi:MAG TPA: hypothetical protein VGO46_06630 [Gemmatimonadaceae bacterium]|nr:hypothetical protein [Gemmatimonadaceae bacterium]
MLRASFGRSILVLAWLTTVVGAASAETTGDICSAPKMQTEKWRPISEAGGLTMLLPPGYAARGNQTVSDRGSSSLGFASAQSTTNMSDHNSADSHFYYQGQHRIIGVGSGSGPSMLTTSGAQMNPMGDCETTIAGRRVEISMYNWNTEDNAMAPSGDAGTHYRAVARFYTSGTQREVFISFQSNIQSDVSAGRQIFWTANFGGAPAQASSAPAQSATAVPAFAGTTSAVVAAAPACVAKADPSLPAASAVLDSALVQMLISGAGPMPKGYALMALKFDGSSLAGISVSQSDLPDPVQKQLATLVASNLKPHDTKAPAAFTLRVDSQEQGLHYTVQGACAQ